MTEKPESTRKDGKTAVAGVSALIFGDTNECTRNADICTSSIDRLQTDHIKKHKAVVDNNCCFHRVNEYEDKGHLFNGNIFEISISIHH